MRYFCEYLESIRTAHLTIELGSPWDAAVSDLLVHDRKHLTLRHAGQSLGIALPCSLEKPQHPPELVVSPDQRSLECRLKDTSPIVEEVDGQVTPFSDPRTLGRSRLACAACSHAVVDGRSLKWRLLPSEHWAELMDSWHCHKGVVDHDHGHAHVAHDHHHEKNSHDNQLHEQYTLPDKIVAAANRIRPADGVGLIGTSYLLLKSTSLTFPTETRSSTLSCPSCSTTLGSIDADGDVRLDKSSLAHDVQRGAAIIRLDRGTVQLGYLLADLLATVSAHSVHRFLIRPLPMANAASFERAASAGEGGEVRAVVLWIMAASTRLTFASTPSSASLTSGLCIGVNSPNVPPGILASKVLYRHPSAAEAARMASVQPAGRGPDAAMDDEDEVEAETEPVDVPADLYNTLLRTLDTFRTLTNDHNNKDTTTQAPGADWRLSYLPRFEGELSTGIA